MLVLGRVWINQSLGFFKDFFSLLDQLLSTTPFPSFFPHAFSRRKSPRWSCQCLGSSGTLQLCLCGCILTCISNKKNWVLPKRGQTWLQKWRELRVVQGMFFFFRFFFKKSSQAFNKHGVWILGFIYPRTSWKFFFFFFWGGGWKFLRWLTFVSWNLESQHFQIFK